MSHQIITKMTYNASTRHIETWQHSNNVWPKTDYFYAMDVGTDEKMFQFIKFIAERSWQGRKWRRQFEILFKEYPELRRESYENELIGKSWKEHCAICRKYYDLAESKRGEIVARFKQLVNIK